MFGKGWVSEIIYCPYWGEVWAQTRRLELKRCVLPRNARSRESALKRCVLGPRLFGKEGGFRESILSILGGVVPLTEGSGLKRGVLS